MGYFVDVWFLVAGETESLGRVIFTSHQPVVQIVSSGECIEVK